MRVALLADIHGNLAALEAVLADADAQGAQAIIAAGDHLATGPRPVEVFTLLQERGAIMIRGNNDQDLVDMRRGRAPDWWRSGLHLGPLRWTAEQLTAKVVAAVELLPEQRVVRLNGAPHLRIVHGSPRDVREPVLPVTGGLVAEVAQVTGLPSTRALPRRLSEVLAEVEEPVMVCGHTHLAWRACLNGQLAINPGSVGVPTNGTGQTDYALLSLADGHWQAELRSVPYDRDRLLADYHETRLYDLGGPVGRIFLADTLAGQRLCLMFFWHARRVARRLGLNAEGWLPDRVWLEAEASFDRAQMAEPYLTAFQRLARGLERAGRSCAASGENDLE
jgi:predicted phosphodiesterase